MASTAALLVLVIVLALAFDYINGFHDTANAVATVVSTNVLPGRTAVIMAAVFNFVGAFAGSRRRPDDRRRHRQSGQDHANRRRRRPARAPSCWNLLHLVLRHPVEFVARPGRRHRRSGLVVRGARTATRPTRPSPNLLTSKGVTLVLEALVLSPLFGFARRLRPDGDCCSGSCGRCGRRPSIAASASCSSSRPGSWPSPTVPTTPRSRWASSRWPWPLFATEPERAPRRLHVPTWVIISCATAMALGTASGGWRIMKTMGHKIIRLRPINGFAAETAAAAVILTASHLHAPVSTTHVISASIMGVGASKRVSAVRWGVARNMLIAWVLTIPISALVSAGVYWLMRMVIAE